jgi:hypothetical protein
MGSKRRRRGLKSLVVVLVLLACIGFVADRVAESLAEERLAGLAEEEAARYDVRTTGASVEVGGFGFLPQLARGEFSDVTLTMGQPSIASVPAQDVTVVMTGIQVPRELLTGDATATVDVGSADLRLRLSPESLTELATRVSGLEGLSLRIVERKLQARASVRGIDVVATVQPQVRDGRIRLVLDKESSRIPDAIRDAVDSLFATGIEIPDLPFGATLEQATVAGQSVVLRATAANVQLSPT